MAQFTKYALEKLGYKPLGSGEILKGAFTRIDVFDIQGITVNVPYLPPLAESINGVPFKIGIGASLNEVCKQLVGDIYVDDEKQWKSETQSSPPFMLLLFGPTREYVGSSTYFKEHEDFIETHDSFSEAKRELKMQSDAVVASLLSSLSITFSSGGRLVRFLHRHSTVLGRSADGKKILDWSIKFNATAYVSSAIDEIQVEELTALSLKKAKTIDRKIAHFYYIGSIETDLLKRFIYFFLCVERLTHSAYSAIDHQAAISSLLSRHGSIEAAGRKLLEANRDSWTNIRNKFIWCSMHKWTHLTDADVEQFERLTKIRNGIAHGKLSEVNGAAVTEVEALVLRILGNP